MKFLRLFGALLVASMQIVAFALIWDYLNSTAAARGREMRGGVPPGITIYFGWIYFALISFVGAIAALLIRKTMYCWLLLSGLLIAWTLWSVPLISQYPIRSSSYLFLGIALFSGGSIMTMSFLRQSEEI